MTPSEVSVLRIQFPRNGFMGYQYDAEGHLLGLAVHQLVDRRELRHVQRCTSATLSRTRCFRAWVQAAEGKLMVAVVPLPGSLSSRTGQP